MIRDLLAIYTAVRICMVGNVGMGEYKGPGNTLAGAAAQMCVGFTCGALVPIAAPVGAIWAVRDVYVNRDKLITAGWNAVAWSQDKVHNLQRSWKQRGALEVEHAAAVGEN